MNRLNLISCFTLKRAMQLGAAVGYNTIATCHEKVFGGLELSFNLTKKNYKEAFRREHKAAAENLSLKCLKLEVIGV